MSGLLQRRRSFIGTILPQLGSTPYAILLSDGRSPFSRFHAAAWSPRFRWRAFPNAYGVRVCADRWLERGWESDRESFTDDPLGDLQRTLATESSRREAPMFSGGAFGYFRYECGRWFEKVEALQPLDPDVPLAEWIFYGAGVVEDRLDGARWAWGDADAVGPADVSPLGLGARLVDIEPLELPHPYAESVALAQQRIAEGEIYQLNLAQPYRAQPEGDPLALWLDWYASNPAEHYAYLNHGERQILSTSPELFLSQVGSRILCRPIKGTRPRGKDPEEDERLRGELDSDEKERAELNMIVDLVRNDFGRICRPGSVRTVSLGKIESYANVHHRVAMIAGETRPEVGLKERLQATFPAGSITGCPKISAMRLIDRLEGGRPRGVFCGAIGWLGSDGDMALNVAIRSVEIEAQRAIFQVGSGIVADSDPAAEERETRHKAATFLRKVEGPFCWRDGDWIKPEANPTPPNAEGVFETMLYRNGRLGNLSAHRERLARSCEALDLVRYDWDWEAEALDLCRINRLAERTARVKLSVYRHGPNRSVWRLDAAPYTPPTGPWRIHPVTVSLGGEGRHKRLDRSVYERALETARENGAEEAMLVDSEGWVCEGARTSLFWLEGETVFRPDPELIQLPGTMAQRVAEAIEALGVGLETANADVGRLRKAEGVFLTNALVGIQPAYWPGESPKIHLGLEGLIAALRERLDRS